MIKVFGKPIRVNKSSQDAKKSNDVGANLFVGNLDAELDEKLLYDTFSAFGVVVTTPKIMRDPDTVGGAGVAEKKALSGLSFDSSSSAYFFFVLFIFEAGAPDGESRESHSSTTCMLYFICARFFFSLSPFL